GIDSCFAGSCESRGPGGIDTLCQVLLRSPRRRVRSAKWCALAVAGARTNERVGLMSQINRAYGVLLPHFGSFASRDAVIDGAIKAEEYGFDSVWVRDHLVYQPHE